MSRRVRSNVNREILNNQARAAAVFAAKELAQQERGVLDWGDFFLLFGNDGFNQDARTRREVVLTKKELKKLGLKADAFGVSGNGSSWAILTPKKDRRREVWLAALQATLDMAWDAACDEQNKQEPKG
jgi:hypothetical protein